MQKNMDMSRLLNLSEPKSFKMGEYICHEGDEGEEMYIILNGQAGVYISSAAEEDILIAKVGAGEFFGEMALFERQPRSATCIAEQDTMCIAVNQENLMDFIVSCPEITEKLLAGLSSRVRQMNEKLYKTQKTHIVDKKIPFAVPANHKDCGYKDKSGWEYIRPVKLTCPVCGAPVTAGNIQVRPGTDFEILPNQRKVYQEVDPLWHLIRSCEQCGYSNYYINFLKLPDAPTEALEEVLAEEKKETRLKSGSEFAAVVMGYYKAIHFNECFNAADTLLLAKLWLFLGWMYEDAGQKNMCAFCHEKSLDYYLVTYSEGQHLLFNEFAISQCAMVIAELYYERQERKKAKEFYHIVLSCSNKRLVQQAYDRIYEIRDLDKEQNK